MMYLTSVFLVCQLYACTRSVIRLYVIVWILGSVRIMTHINFSASIDRSFSLGGVDGRKRRESRPPYPVDQGRSAEFGRISGTHPLALFVPFRSSCSQPQTPRAVKNDRRKQSIRHWIVDSVHPIHDLCRLVTKPPSINMGCEPGRVVHLGLTFLTSVVSSLCHLLHPPPCRPSSDIEVPAHVIIRTTTINIGAPAHIIMPTTIRSSRSTAIRPHRYTTTLDAAITVLRRPRLGAPAPRAVAPRSV